MKMGRKIGARGLAKEAGQKTYFTGNPCPRGHISRRLVSNWTCLSCLQEKTKQKLKERPHYRRRVNEMSRQYRLKNLEKDRTNHSLWKKNNPDKVAEYTHRKRALKNSADGSYTVAESKQLLISQDHLCANPHCVADLRIIKKHLDHKIPLSRGGSNSIENLQWLCESCNCRKWKYTNDEWLVLQAA